jgi:hypothetical protein
MHPSREIVSCRLHLRYLALKEIHDKATACRVVLESRLPVRNPARLGMSDRVLDALMDL